MGPDIQCLLLGSTLVGVGIGILIAFLVENHYKDWYGSSNGTTVRNVDLGYDYFNGIIISIL